MIINILSILFIILFFFTLFYLLNKNTIRKNLKNKNLIKQEKTNDYKAKIFQKNLSNLEMDLNKLNNKDIKITNIQVGDFEGNFKEIFKFNEKIYVHLDYELPSEGVYFFYVDLDLSIEDKNRKIDLNKYIKRTKIGNTGEYPITFLILGKNDSEEINIKNIKIVVYKAGNFELPVYDINQTVNIIIEPEDNEILKNKLNNENNIQNIQNIQNNKIYIDLEENMECIELINDLYKKLKIQSIDLLPNIKENIEKLKKCSEKNYVDSDYLLEYYDSKQ